MSDRLKFVPTEIKLAAAAGLALASAACTSPAETNPTPTATPARPAPTATATPRATEVPRAIEGSICKGQRGTVRIVGMQNWYADLPVGREGIIDPNEPWIEQPAVGGEMIVRRPGSTQKLTTQPFVDAKPVIPGVDHPVLKRNSAYAYAVVPNMTCDTQMTMPDGRVVPAVTLNVVSSQHEGNTTFVHSYPLGELTPVQFGRLKSREEFLKMVDSGAPVRNWSADTQRVLRNNNSIGESSNGNGVPSATDNTSSNPFITARDFISKNWPWLLVGTVAVAGIAAAARFANNRRRGR